MNFYDCHCHLNDARLYNQIDEVIDDAKDNNCLGIFNNGDNYSSFKIIETISKKYNNYCFSVLGIHPEFASNKDDFIKAMKYIENNYKNIKAIGEIGLDYHYSKEESYVKDQKEIFIKQIRLAKKFNLPIVVHSRDASFDTLNIIKEEKPDKVYLHCYSDSKEIFNEYIKFNNNIKFGIGGVITFKNSKTLKEIVSTRNLNSFLTETDAPYLTPEPFRGKINKPSYIKYVIEKIAEIKEMEIEKVSQILLNNCKDFYGLR